MIIPWIFLRDEPGKLTFTGDWPGILRLVSLAEALVLEFTVHQSLGRVED